MATVHRVADAITALFGCWALYSWVCVYAGLSFDLLRFGLVLPLIAAGTLVWTTRPAAEVRPEPAPAPPDPRLAGATLALAIAGFFGWWNGLVPLPAAGAAALVHLAVVLRGARTGTLDAGPPTRWDAFALVLAACIAVTAALVLNRPDIDDAYYFNAIWTTLAHSDRAVLSFDGMHGEPGAPIQQLIHRPQTFELLAAVVASVPGIDAASAYYVVLPIVNALVMVFGTWLVLRQVTRHPGVALLFVLAVLLSWGDGHRTWGNYAFVRLYQGKAVFLCTMAPLVIHQSFRFARDGTVHRGLMLAAAVCAAASVTSSALVVTPVVVGLALLGANPLTPDGLKRGALGLLATVPPLLVLGLVQLELSRAAPLVTEGDILDLRALTASGVRGPLALSGTLMLPWLLQVSGAPSAAAVTRWIAACFLFVLGGFTAPVLGDAVAALLSWRLYWAVPVPVFVAAAITTGAGLVIDGVRSRLVPVGLLGASAVVLGGVFLAGGRWTVDTGNRVSYHFAEPKRPAHIWRLGRQVVDAAPPGSSVLAPTRVACFLTGFEDVPKLVAVREFYTANLARFWGEEESATRQALQSLAEGNANRRQTTTALAALESRCIEVVVTASRARKRKRIAQGLAAQGFERRRRGAYDLWTRKGPHAACNAAQE